jgi:hypothetical protein
MARVWRALDAATAEPVALKLLHVDNAAARAQFRREYAALAKLQHPRVIRAFEYGTSEQGVPYYTMELVEGQELLALTLQPWRRACEILRDVCTSLALLHAQRLVHRDVSPRNVRLDHEGRAKLLDFGALAPFGVPSDIVGTPVCMAPEALRRGPLDARTDLFALGAVAYWLLTRRSPYSIRTLDDAEAAWREVPAPPSAVSPDVPRGLDELVSSLLCPDPNGRPSSAPEVLDRLSAIAALDDEALLGVAESHVSSATLVGRDTELARLTEVLTLATQRHGTMVTLAGERGAGKTRLLRELTVEAQLAGFVTVGMRAAEHTRNEALCSALVRSLRRRAPALTLSTGLLDERGELALPAPLDEYAHEAVLRVQVAVTRLVAEVAQRAPLLITIDDADALDPAASGLLAMLARATLDRSLVVAVARGAKQAAPALALLAAIGESLTLAPLDLPSIEQLVLGTFGDVPHRARLSNWLLQASRGNPGQVRRALNLLLERRAIQYFGAAWLLPADLSEQQLPSDDEHGPTTLASLSDAERLLLRLLLAHERPLAREVCTRLLPQGEYVRALSRLEQLGFARADGVTVTTLQPTLRHALLDELPARERGALHARLADALLAALPTLPGSLRSARIAELSVTELVAAVEIGEHRLLAGEARRALPLLKAGAVELTKRGDGLHAAVPALVRAVDLCRVQRRPRVDYAAMMTALALAGTYHDWRLSYRYGEELLDALADHGGMKTAGRLAKVVPGPLALYVALGLAFLRFLLLPRRRLAAKFSDLLLGVIGLGTSEAGVCAVLQDAERARAVVARLEGLEHFPDGHPAREIRRYQVALAEQASGDYVPAHARARDALVYVQSDRGRRRLPPEGRGQLEAGILILLGQLDACRTDGSAERTLSMLEAIDNAKSRPTLAATRVAYHCHRGERAEYLQWHRRVDQLAAEQGATWRNDVQLPRWLWSTHMLCADVVTLKRDFEQLRALAAQVPTIARLGDVLHASYLCERGSPVEALERHRAVLASALSERGLRAAQQLGAYARILRRAGEHAEAVSVCETTLARLSAQERAFPVLIFSLQRELPLALAMLGQRERARAQLDALILAQASHDNPLLHGLAHGARAELAVLERDAPSFDAHLGAMRRWFQGCENPALHAQCQRLIDAMRGDSSPATAASIDMDADTETLEPANDA